MAIKYFMMPVSLLGVLHILSPDLCKCTLHIPMCTTCTLHAQHGKAQMHLVLEGTKDIWHICRI